jgi:hypothetical protein
MWVKTEYIWAGSFAICASVVISVVGAGLLGVSQMQAKWQVKLATVLQSNSEGNRLAASRDGAQEVCYVHASVHYRPFEKGK